MAVDTVVTAEQESRDQARVEGSDRISPVAVCLSPAYTDASSESLAELGPWLREAIGGANAERPFLVGYPVTHGDVQAEEHDGVVLQPFLQVAPVHSVLVQTAASWLSAFELLRAHGAKCCVLLGPDVMSLHPAPVTEMVRLVSEGRADLALPRYDIPTTQGLLNTGLLSPLSRAIFGADVRFPLSLDFVCSDRMAERMAGAAQRFTAANQPDAEVWPVAEAATASFSLAEVPAGPRRLPETPDDLSALLARIAGSLFADIEAKATYWQRTRPAARVERSGPPSEQTYTDAAPSSKEIGGLIESFRNGYANLHELWALLLPPNTLVQLKRLASAPEASFLLMDATWVRIVYDFVLAHRLRTLARNHLMGAFAPLYLAWVASHLTQPDGNAHAERVARAFEADKPYLVSRWRWPDRFNP